MYKHSSKIAFKGKNKESSKNGLSGKRKTLAIAFILASIALLISAPQMNFSTSAIFTEPSLEEILNNLGYTNIDVQDLQTFPAGIYNITLLAEFAVYNKLDALSYYIVETTEYQTIFTGPEGITYSDGGYVEPPLSKIIDVYYTFGISMLAPKHRYFTEHELNPDYPQHHAQVFKNLDDPNTLLIGFENYCGGFDRDYNDMIFALTRVNPIEILNVTNSPSNPNYDEPVTVSAQVEEGIYEIDTVILSYQIGSSSWTNVTMNLDKTKYTITIPAQSYGTSVKYKIYATDAHGSTVVSTDYDYTVGDFIAPLISDVVKVPNTPIVGSFVTVSAKITEPTSASGVKNVTLFYNDENAGYSTPMTNDKGLWYGTISGQTSGKRLQFYVKAFDNAENVDKTQIFTYQVITFNKPPTANFSAPHKAYTGESVNFDGSSSYDLDGSIFSYSWSFNDRTTANGVNISHTFSTEGEYVVTLTVKDDRGTTDSESKTILIEDKPASTPANKEPVAVFTGSPEEVHTTEAVNFDASESFDIDGTITTYTWTFGDGTTATGKNVTHVYEANGPYSVKLTVKDNEGATDSTTSTINILNSAPVAVLKQTPEKANKAEEVSFDASESFDIDGTITESAWTFGDGTTATGKTVSHAYSNSGLFAVTLRVIDDDGATDSAMVTVNVVNENPVAIFSAKTGPLIEKQLIQFNASESYDIDGTITTYTWNFGDETTANGVTTEHAYLQEGNYTISLTVTDNDGASASATVDMNIEAEPTLTLAILSVISIGITALTATLSYGLFVQRNKKEKDKKTN